MPGRLRRLAAIPFLLAIPFASASAQDAGVRVDPTPPPPDKSAFTLLDPTPTDDMRGFATDRPTKSNSPITVDAGHFQYESDLFNYLHSNAGGVSSRLYTAFDPVLKVGLTNHLDLELQFTGYNWLDEKDPGNGSPVLHAQGAGDLYLRLKANLFGNEGGPALAIIPYVKFPTAASNIGNGAYEGGVIAPFSYPLPLGLTLLVESEVDVLKNMLDFGHHFSFTQLANLSHPVGKEVTVYAELYSAIGTDAHTPAVYTADFAAAWQVTPTFQLDAGVNIGLNKDSPNLQLYTGIAQRF